jgi:hypothetical protein
LAPPRLGLLFALALHHLDRRTNLSALWDQAIMLNKCAYLLAACHDDIFFRGVIIDRKRLYVFPLESINWEVKMLFRLSYSIPVELLKECQERFKSGEEKTDGLKVIGRWHEVGKNQGFMLAEADDIMAVGTFTNQWSDLCNMEVVPVMTDEQVGQILMA